VNSAGTPNERGESEFPFAEVPEVVDIAPRSIGTFQKWVPILLKFTSVQAVVQVLALAAGILIIRHLPKREYALYTLGNTMLATILALSDSGISSAMTAIGGRIWQDDHRLSQLIKTALRSRRTMALVAFPVVTPVLIWLLIQNGARSIKVVTVTAAVLVGGLFELTTRIYSVALRLKSEIRQIQNQAIVGAVVKLGIVAVGILVWFNVEIAILSLVAGYVFQFWMLRRWTAKNLHVDSGTDPGMRSEIFSVVRRQSPQTIYWCLQGQITVWLIGIFGNPERLADVGALSRLAMIFLVLASVASELLFPAFARITNVYALRKRYFQMMLAYTLFSFLLVGLIALFPRTVFGLLGNRYSQLTADGILMAIGTVLWAIATMAWGLNASRAWILPPLKFIVVSIAFQILLVKFIDLSTVRGVINLTIFSAIPAIIWPIGFAMREMGKMRAQVSESVS